MRSKRGGIQNSCIDDSRVKKDHGLYKPTCGPLNNHWRTELSRLLKVGFREKFFYMRRPGKALFKGSEFSEDLSMGIGFQFSRFLVEKKKGCLIHGGGGNMGTPGSPATPLLRLIMLNLGDVIDWKEAVILSFTNNFVA